ncbi:hypothetical protein [Imbroritus primus]|uniref:hypothetical protein n=1 Tax=Imbroritus primus TaxID=3058603 RepID=UPI003D1612F9
MSLIASGMHTAALAMMDHLIACGRTGATLGELAACADRDLVQAQAVLQAVLLGRQIAEVRDGRFYIRLARPRSQTSMTGRGC